MNRKKTILHIIQNFGIGGAETALVGVLKNLSEYNNVVVTLDGFNQFGADLKYDKYYNLNLKSYYLFPLAINKLKKIIGENNVDLVHSQLYWSTVLARFATPKHIPLVTSVQASLSDSVEYRKKWICRLERYSYKRRKSTILGVSEHTLNDYFSFLQLKRHKTHVLYNYVDTAVFGSNGVHKTESGTGFKVITVGNLKPQKNQSFLLEAFRELKGLDISLDIYGEGILKDGLEKTIRSNGLAVSLKGKVRNLNNLLEQYDLFVMSSLYEGFSLAVLEGMVMQKPMLLSDIDTFREQCAGTAEYFSLGNAKELADKIVKLKNDSSRLQKMGTEGKQRVLNHFTLNHHLSKLREIYKEELS